MINVDWKWIVELARFNDFIRSYDSNGNYNGLKILTGYNEKKNTAIYSRLTYTMDMVWMSPIGASPVIKRQELWMVN